MSLGDFGRDMLAEAARIAQQAVAREGTHLRWATVTDTDPLRIRYDGEPNPSIVTPQNTVAGLQVGDRVAVGKQHGQALIVGRAGGGGPIGRERLPIRAAEGIFNYPDIGPGGIETVTITMPAGRFTRRPALAVLPTSPRITPSFHSGSAESINVRLANWTSSNAPAASSNWIAVET